MDTGTIVAAGIVFLLAALCAVCAWRHFRENGYLFNNAWIWASEEEREQMDKRPYYRQTAVVLCLISLIFLLLGLYTLMKNGWLLWAQGAVTVLTLVYAVVSSVRLERNRR